MFQGYPSICMIVGMVVGAVSYVAFREYLDRNHPAFNDPEGKRFRKIIYTVTAIGWLIFVGVISLPLFISHG